MSWNGQRLTLHIVKNQQLNGISFRLEHPEIKTIGSGFFENQVFEEINKAKIRINQEFSHIGIPDADIYSADGKQLLGKTIDSIFYGSKLL